MSSSTPRTVPHELLFDESLNDPRLFGFIRAAGTRGERIERAFGIEPRTPPQFENMLELARDERGERSGVTVALFVSAASNRDGNDSDHSTYTMVGLSVMLSTSCANVDDIDTPSAINRRSWSSLDRTALTRADRC